METFVENIDGEDVFYIFNFTPLGYVIISADDISTPVLGYSYSQNYETINHPPAFDDLLECYALQIDYARDEGIAPFQETTELWNRLSVNPDDFIPETISRDVEPLLATIWDQNWPYNKLCPDDPAGPGGHAYAGCVATTMGQVMKYWNYPDQGNGSHGYSHPDYGYIFANFGATTYDWNNMPNSLTNPPATQTEIDAVATLLYHCGVSVDSDYGPDGTAAWDYGDTIVADALSTYFGYSDSASDELKANYYNWEWIDMLTDELDNSRPIIYGGYGTGGHAFIIDGYEDGDHFHINWGWSGSYNGLYYLDDLTPGSNNNFTQFQEAVIGIEPENLVRLEGDVDLIGGYGNYEDITITYTNDDGDVYTTYSNSSGDYLFPPNILLPEGWCTVTAELNLYETSSEETYLWPGNNYCYFYLYILNGTISGHVELDEGNGNVEDVTITLSATQKDSTKSYEVHPDEEGNYSADVNPYCYWEVEASLANYATEIYPDLIYVEPTDVVSGIDFTLYPVHISGNVTLSGGSGDVQDVEVTAGEVTVNPDQLGNYVLEVAPGTYDVTASLTGYYSETYTNVYLSPNQHTTGIDFTLQYNPTGTIEGTVTLSGGSGNVEDVKVGAGGQIVYPNSSGYYIIILPAGTYDVNAYLPAYFTATVYDVEVELGATTTVDFTLNYHGNIIVNQNGNGDFTTIQEGIDAANDGDVVWVMNGVYSGENNTNLNWSNKHITVRSHSGSNNCIIEGYYNPDLEGLRAFELSDPNINNSDRIIGFTIRDFYLGQYYYPPELKKGAGIFVYNGASPTIENCIIEDCFIDNEYGADHIGFGVGIYCEGSTIIKNCTIQENEGWDIQGGAGIACKGNVTIDGCTIRNNLIGKYVGFGGPDVEYAGAGIFAYSSDNGSPTIINNTIYDNHHECDGPGAAIYIYEDVETDIPVKILNNTIYNNPPEGSYGSHEALCIVDGGKPIEICGNLIYNNNTTAVGSHYHWSLGPPVGPYYFTFENNTIMNNNGDGLYIYEGELTLTKNNIIVGNSNYGIHWDTGTEGLSVRYSILYDNSYGNYDTTPTHEFRVYYIDPKVDSGNDYQPIWTEQLRSPCIDTGDPDPQYNDPDESRSDIGAIPAITHKYDKWELPPITVDNGWKWMSFPALDDLTNNPGTFDGDMAEYMLVDILNIYILDHIEWKPLDPQGAGLEYIEYEDGDWTYLDHIFTSSQGYKFKMSDYLGDYKDLKISGFLEEPNTVIHLWGNLEDNWIGYFIDETQKVEDAFGEAMDNLYSIKTHHWTMIRERPIPGHPWIIPVPTPTFSYGDMVIVECFEDMDFTWSSTGGGQPHERMGTTYFTFEEQADYVPIFVEFDPENIPDEVGVLVDGECKGASVVEDTLAQVCAYILGCNGGELEFEMYYDNKGTESNLNVKDYFVYNPKTKLKEKRIIKVDENKDYYLVSFKADESETIPEYLSIQNFPNPFNPDIIGTTIQYALPQETEVTIMVYNLKGQKIKTLVNRAHTPGIYTAIWDGKNEAGNFISNGIYFYKLETNNKTLIKKMLLVR